MVCLINTDPAVRQECTFPTAGEGGDLDIGCFAVGMLWLKTLSRGYNDTMFFNCVQKNQENFKASCVREVWTVTRTQVKMCFCVRCFSWCWKALPSAWWYPESVRMISVLNTWKKNQWFICFFIFVKLGTEARATNVLDKHSTSEFIGWLFQG